MKNSEGDTKVKYDIFHCGPRTNSKSNINCELTSYTMN